MAAGSIDSSQAEAPFVLAIDIGSSSARAGLYDRRARAISGIAAQQTYRLSVDLDGRADDDAIRAAARVAACIDEVLQRAGPLAAQIAAVTSATMAGTLLGLDGNGAPVTPLITYADTRAGSAAEALRRRLDEAAIHQRTGCLLRSSYWPAQLMMLREQDPAAAAQARHWVTLGDWLERVFFGRGRVSFSAAAWTGLLNRATLSWDHELAAQVGVDLDQLSEVVDVDQPISGLQPTYAARWPALAAVPWLPAVGDGAAANIGSGCTRPGRLAMTVGTSGALRLVQPTPPQVPDGLWCYRVDRAQALVGGATSEGGNLHAWLRQTLQLSDPETLEAQLAAQRPDSHGLTILPFIAGERSPGWAGNVPATIHGITLATRPIDLVRAGLEAVALRFGMIAERLRRVSSPIELVIASGGALTASPAWLQICADVLNIPLAVAAQPEATSRGAVLLALRTIGATNGLDALPAELGTHYLPDLERHEAYRAAAARQQWFYDRLIGAAAADR